MTLRPWRPGFVLLAVVFATACGRKETASPPPAGGAPSAPAAATQDAPVEGQPAVGRPTDIDWILVRLGEQTIPPRGRTQMRLRLVTGDKEAQGQAICNTFRSRFELDEAGLRFGPLTVTRKACPAGLDVEKRFFAAIEKTSRWTIEGDRLILSDASGQQLARFAQRPAD